MFVAEDLETLTISATSIYESPRPLYSLINDEKVASKIPSSFYKAFYRFRSIFLAYLSD